VGISTDVGPEISPSVFHESEKISIGFHIGISGTETMLELTGLKPKSLKTSGDSTAGPTADKDFGNPASVVQESEKMSPALLKGISGTDAADAENGTVSENILAESKPLAKYPPLISTPGATTDTPAPISPPSEAGAAIAVGIAVETAPPTSPTTAGIAATASPIPAANDPSASIICLNFKSFEPI
jgi:hypothetical protein